MCLNISWCITNCEFLRVFSALFQVDEGLYFICSISRIINLRFALLKEPLQRCATSGIEFLFDGSRKDIMPKQFCQEEHVCVKDVDSVYSDRIWVLNLGRALDKALGQFLYADLA